MTTEAEQTEIRVGEIAEGGSPVGAAVLRLIAAAEVRGYQRAIAALRDEAADRDSRALCLRNAANYLESLTTEGTKP